MQRVINRTGILALAVGAVLTWPAVGSAQDAAPAGDAHRGMQLFEQHGCYTCHGYSGQGGAGTGPRLSNPVLPYEAVHEQLRHPRDAMPPYQETVVPDQDVADIYAYLKSVPEPQKAADIPLIEKYLSN